jgi:DNA-binding response OmpR family regulator
MTEQISKGVVLVVDDEPDIRDTLATLLNYLGYSPLVAQDRDNALDLVKAKSPDAVILDWQMPGMTIEVFLEQVRNMKRQPGIVLLTAGYRAADKAQELGLQHFIPKPFDLDVLEKKLSDCLSTPN